MRITTLFRHGRNLHAARLGYGGPSRRPVAGAVRATTLAVSLGCAIAAASAVAGCAEKDIVGEKKPICDTRGGVEHYLVVASSSTSDLATAREYAPKVIDAVLPRVARTCGTLTVAVATNQSERLIPHPHALTPKEPTAYNAETQRTNLEKEARAFAEENFLVPLSKIASTPGSPFLGTIQKIASEAEGHPEYRGTLVIIGDSVDIEPSPVAGKPRIDFRRDVSQEDLDDFDLEGGPRCVIMMGAGQSSLPAHRLASAREMLKTTLNRAGIGFVASSSTSVPAGCPEVSAR